MASFYNNYYRYYRPFSSTNFKGLPDVSKDCSVNDKTCYEHFHENTNHASSANTSTQKEKSSRYHSFGPIHFKNPIFENVEEPIFEIFGIQLYLDDIIILGLLFFLYQEGVQDEMLYIALILLLVS